MGWPRLFESFGSMKFGWRFKDELQQPGWEDHYVRYDTLKRLAEEAAERKHFRSGEELRPRMFRRCAGKHAVFGVRSLPI